MPCIVTIILLSQHLCYNWIVASISIFVGMIIFLIYSYQMSNAYPFNSTNFYYYYLIISGDTEHIILFCFHDAKLLYNRK